MIVALVIFGPNKLPELGKSLGQGIREFKRATQSLTEEVTKAATEEIPKQAAAPAQQPQVVPQAQIEASPAAPEGEQPPQV